MKRKLKIAAGATALLAAVMILISSHPLRAQQDAVPAPPAPPVAPAGPDTVRIFNFQGGAFLGVGLKDVTPAEVSSMKLPGEYGAIVAHVEPDSPAAKAGLEENDVILEYGGMRVWSASQLSQLVRETPVGRGVELRVSRTGKTMTLHATLAERHAPRAFSYNGSQFRMPPMNLNFDFGFPRYRLGAEVESLTPQLATYFGVKQDKGVLVTEVEANSPAAKAGLKAGDCIVKAGSTEVTSVSDLRRALNDASQAQIRLSIVRSGQERTLSATLEAAPSMMNDHQMFRREMERQAQTIRREVPRYQEQMRRLQREFHSMQVGDV